MLGCSIQHFYNSASADKRTKQEVIGFEGSVFIAVISPGGGWGFEVRVWSFEEDDRHNLRTFLFSIMLFLLLLYGPKRNCKGTQM